VDLTLGEPWLKEIRTFVHAGLRGLRSSRGSDSRKPVKGRCLNRFVIAKTGVFM
jgi:hypothetical protein